MLVIGIFQGIDIGDQLYLFGKVKIKKKKYVFEVLMSFMN